MMRRNGFFYEFSTEIKMFIVVFVVAVCLLAGVVLMVKSMYESTTDSLSDPGTAETKKAQ